MRLYNVKLSGFRRFEAQQSLNLSSKLTAIVGPNEAGKTSLLKAISYCNDTTPIAPNDATSLSDVTPIIILSFFLDKEDLDVAGLVRPSWLHLTKKQDGGLNYEVKPQPDRTVIKRLSTAKHIRKTFGGRHKKDFESSDLIGASELEKLLTTLETNAAPLADNQIHLLEQLRDGLDEGVDWGKSAVAAEEMSSLISELLSFEASHNPHQHAINVLAQRVPQIINFSTELRDLRIPYDLSLFDHPDPNTNRKPSQSLGEIFRLAGLDLTVLKRSIDSGNGAGTEGLIRAANEKLAEQSAGLWTQSDATLYLKLDGYSIDILVRNVNGFEILEQFSNFAQRSDGYKQFVALQIFTFLQKVDGAILLIDELEHHLHYDAQAELVQILQREPSIGSVIYTTHSAGALPEDLGVGVRMVNWDEKRKKVSKIINKFWQSDPSGGFKPLLFGMGAASLAFFPTRKALIGEGPTELLLLPRMLREALSAEALDFQVVHGLAHINPKGLPMFDNLSNGICFMLDNDDSGNEKAKELLGVGVPKEQIFSVKEICKNAVTLEDLIDSEMWLRTVNLYIDQYGHDRGLNDRIEAAPEFGRINALPQSIRKEKVAFAYGLLDMLQDDPTRKILSRKYEKKTRSIAEKIKTVLGLT